MKKNVTNDLPSVGFRLLFAFTNRTAFTRGSPTTYSSLAHVPLVFAFLHAGVGTEKASRGDPGRRTQTSLGLGGLAGPFPNPAFES